LRIDRDRKDGQERGEEHSGTNDVGHAGILA